MRFKEIISPSDPLGLAKRQLNAAKIALLTHSIELEVQQSAVSALKQRIQRLESYIHAEETPSLEMDQTGPLHSEPEHPFSD